MSQRYYRTHLAVFVHIAAQLPDTLGHLLDVGGLRGRVPLVREHSRRVVLDPLHRLLLVHLGERRLPQEVLYKHLQEYLGMILMYSLSKVPIPLLFDTF